VIDSFVPLVSFLAVKVVNPVADAVLLVESSSRAAHVRDTAAVFVAHVEQHALEFLVGVESKGSVSAVESECHVRELLPSFSLQINYKLVCHFTVQGNCLFTIDEQSVNAQRKLTR